MKNQPCFINQADFIIKSIILQAAFFRYSRFLYIR